MREDEEEDEKKEEKEGAEEKDEEESNIVYRFKVECVKGKKGSKKSKSKAD